jgi:predicted dehydrogenase
VRTAVVGVGRMGRRHIQVVQGMGLDLVGICDASLDSLAAAQKENNIPAALHFTDIKSLLAQTRPECVVIATTAPTHCEYTCLAAESGAKFILCEKPMAVSLAQCDRMISTCARHGAQLAINHQMRFMEQYTIPKELLRSPEFGGLASVTISAGNFGLAMNGSHYFEMFRFISDENPQEVTAWFSSEKVSNPRGAQFEDRAGSIRITSASGKRFYLDCSADQGHGMRVVYSARNGQIYIDELKGQLLASVREEQYLSLPTTRYSMPAKNISTQITPADTVAPSSAVLHALLNGSNPPCGEAGRMAVAVLVAAYISDENGHRPVCVDNHLPVERQFPWA